MTGEYDKLRDIAEKINIAKKVITVIDRDPNDTSEHPLDTKFEEYTGWPLNDTITEKSAHFFQKYYKSKEKSNEVDTVTLRKKLIEWYLIDEMPPNIQHIREFLAVKQIGDPEMFFYRAAKYGFVWKQIPGTKKALFLESSQRIAERIAYLKKITKLRETGKDFVYMNINIPVSIYKVVVSTKLGVLCDSDEKKRDFRSWFCDILDKVKEPSVFVYPQLWKIKLSPFSTKTTLMSYLTDRGIPFNPKFHRSELFELCKRSTGDKEDDISALCSEYGHESVARPHFTSNIISDKEPLDIFSPFASRIAFKYKFAEADGTSDVDWKECEAQLIVQEKEMYEEDLQMETMIDKLMTYGKYEADAPGYMTDYSEVLKYDPQFGPANAFYE